MRMSTRWIPLLLAPLLAAPASAQDTPAAYTQTFDMHLPPASVASCPGPLSLGYNPAGMAFAGEGDSFNLLYLHHERIDAERGGNDTFTGRADGLLLGFGRFGFGLQWVRPYDDVREYDYIKYTLAAPLLNIQRWFSLGVGLEILDPTETNEDAAVDYMAGAMVRPFRFISLGLTGRNLGRARISGIRAPRTLDLGVAVRPLWFAPERVTLAADFRLVDGAGDPPVRFTGFFSILDGLHLFGTADLDGNFGAGLAVDFQRVGAGGYVDFSSQDGVEPGHMVLMARVSSDLHPGFSIGRKRTVEITIDHQVVSDFCASGGWFFQRTTLYDLIQAVHRAAADQGVDSMLVNVTDHDLAWTDIQELRAALLAFRQAGKKLFFYLEGTDTRTYYLASAADAIYLQPTARVDVTGPSVQTTYFGGALTMLGARVDVSKIGDYKTAPEMLTREEPSGPALEVMNSLADEAADQMLAAVGAAREIPRDRLQEIVDRGMMTPEGAVEAGLADGVVYFDEISDRLAEQLGHNPRRVQHYVQQRSFRDRWGGRPVVAVVHARGTIAPGGLLGQFMDARQLAQILDELGRDAEVEAVVLRVDSPGGDVTASDMIWRQVERLKKRKPVVVSMGPVAASGGYYISCAADTIVANPGTITGSIGIFSIGLDIGELYARLGISRETVKRGEMADFDNTFRGWTDKEAALVSSLIDELYQGFIERVAQGRDMSTDQVDAVARGRVWTGRQARERGLVDELGGLDDAIRIARQKADIAAEEDVRIVHLPRPGLSWQGVMRRLGLATGDSWVIPEPFRGPLARLAALTTLGGKPALALMPLWVWIE